MIKEYKGILIKDRELSWLSFNERVLQEAEDPDVPLMERLKFLAIFSSNMDEFFRVRVASIRRAIKAKRTSISPYRLHPETILELILERAVKLQDTFQDAYARIRQELEEKIPTMTREQLVETVTTCLDMIERLENDLTAGTHKLEEMSALVKKLSETKQTD